MAITVDASGSQTAVIGTEHVLNTDANSGTLILRVNLVNMAAGDYVRLRIYSQVLNADALAVVYEGNFANAPDASSVIQQSIPVVSDQGAKATLQQLAGTGRVFPWSLLRL